MLSDQSCRAGLVVAFVSLLNATTVAQRLVVPDEEHGFTLSKGCVSPMCRGQNTDCTFTFGYGDDFGDTLKIHQAWDEILGLDLELPPQGLEIIGDTFADGSMIGNDNGQCESNEVCTGSLPIVLIEGNAECTNLSPTQICDRPTGQNCVLPCFVGPPDLGHPLSPEAGRVTFRQNSYQIPANRSQPVIDQAHVRWEDLCDASETSGCSFGVLNMGTTTAATTLWPDPKCDITGEDEICSGESTEFCAPPGMESYEWRDPDGQIISNTQCITLTKSAPDQALARVRRLNLARTGSDPKPGDYCVTVTDANGCVNTCCRTLVVHLLPVCEVQGDQQICADEVSNFCATEEFPVYQWSRPDEIMMSTERCTGPISVSGEYELTVTDELGCQGKCSRTLQVDPLPECLITGDDQICAGESSEFCATPGMAGYEWTGPDGFTWNDQCTGPLTIEGEYCATVTDVNGCDKPCCRTLRVRPLPPCEIIGDPEICVGETSEFCAPPGMVSYEWSGPGGFTGLGECTGAISVAGEYCVTLVDSNGCESTCCRTLTVHPLPPCEITGDNEICAGESTEFCAPPGMDSYEWTGPGIPPGLDTPCTGPITVAGDYCVTIIDPNGCESTCCRPIIVNPLPRCEITGDNEICVDESTVFCAPEGMEIYEWTGPVGFTGSQRCTGSITLAGEYCVTIVDANGCESTCCRTLTVYPEPVCTITGDNEICADEDTGFCCSPGLTLGWTGPGGFTSTQQCIDPITVPGDYCCTVVDENGCDETCCRNLTVDPLPPCEITGDNEICEGESTEFCCPDGASCRWTGPGLPPSLTAPCTGPINQPGEYCVIITDANGCESSCCRTLTVDPLPPCSITGDNEICADESTEFCATPGMASYAWTGPGGFISTNPCTGPITVAGEYCVIIIDGNDCESNCCRTLTVDPLPPCMIEGDPEICVGETSEFCAPPGMGSYAWTGPGGFTGIGQCTGPISVAGEYCGTIIDSNGCESSCCRTLTVDPLPPCEITGESEICEGDEALFCCPGTLTGPGIPNAPGPCVPIVEPGEYCCEISDTNGCESNCCRTLTVDPLPPCMIEGDPEICVGETSEFCAPPGMASYAWTGPGGFTGIGQCTGPISVAGEYCIAIIDMNGCESSCCRTLTVHPLPVCTIEGDPEICADETTQFCAPPGMVAYEWERDELVIGNSRCTGSIDVAGDYCVTITDINGCKSRCCQRLTVHPLPPCEITGHNDLCAGGSTNFCAPPGMDSYEWTGPGGFTGNVQCTDTISLPGDYCVTIVDSNGCESTCCRTLTVHVEATCEITMPPPFCVDDFPQICATTGMGTYRWRGPGINPPEPNGRCLIVPVVPGEYCCDVTDIHGCPASCCADLRPACCGDSIVGNTDGETCDPPSTIMPNGNRCREDCRYCGDGLVNGSERCDDANSNDTDACRNDCTPNECEGDCEPVTKAHFDIWNENERKLSGTYRCIAAWDQELLSRYTPNGLGNNLLRPNLQTDKGKARIDGLLSQQCEENCLRDPSGQPLPIEDIVDIFGTDVDVTCSEDNPFLGVAAKVLAFNGKASARAGSELVGMGLEPGQIAYDLLGGPPPTAAAGVTTPDSFVKSIRSTTRGGSPAMPGDLSAPLQPERTISQAAGGPQPPNGIGRGSTTQKGSLIVYPKVEIKWDASGNVIQDTFLALTNDYSEEVTVQLYFVHGDVCTWVDNAFILTPNQSVYWSVLTGQPVGASPFTVLQERCPDDDPENPGGTRMRGYVVAWAVDQSTNREIRWNHLSGTAMLLNYRDVTAWEYNAWAFRAAEAVAHGAVLFAPYGRLNMNGAEYEYAPDQLLLDFFASGAMVNLSGAGVVSIDTDLTLWILDADFRENPDDPFEAD